MNNEEMSTMNDIVAVTNYLVAIWRRSKCPDECKYNELCERLDELSKVVEDEKESKF